jgi:hypothetical protein
MGVDFRLATGLQPAAHNVGRKPALGFPDYGTVQHRLRGVTASPRAQIICANIAFAFGPKKAFRPAGETVQRSGNQ